MRPDRVIVVDDDLSMRQMLSILLKRSGYDVVSAASAEDALKKLDDRIAKHGSLADQAY